MRQGNVARHNRIAVALLLAAFIALLAVLSLGCTALIQAYIRKDAPIPLQEMEITTPRWRSCAG